MNPFDLLRVLGAAGVLALAGMCWAAARRSPTGFTIFGAVLAAAVVWLAGISDRCEGEVVGQHLKARCPKVAR